MNDDLTSIFLEELRDLLESLDRGLMDLGATPDDTGLVNQVFRDLHTIKGSGAMFGFAALADFIHRFETLFDHIRSGDAKVTPAVIALSLAARDEIPGLAEGTPDPDGRREALLAQLEALMASPDAPATQTRTETGDRNFAFHLEGEALALGTRPEILLDELRGLGAHDIRAVTEDVPPLSDLNPGCCALRWTMRLPPTVTKDQIEEVFLFAEASWTLEDAAQDAAQDAGESPAIDAAAPAPAPAPAPVMPRADAPLAVLAPVPAVEPAAPADGPRRATAGQGATLRVPTGRLDAMLDAVGELVIVEARLSELAQQSRDPMLLATAEQITRLATGLRDTTMTLRLVPMTSLVARFRRLVLDVSGRIGKPVDFVVEGEDTELDKTVIDKIADPIMHLLRNALDHGLESPEDRVAAGKPAKGRITLSAVHAGAEVRISIRDDGRGMDAERLRQRAVARGLIAADAVLTQRQCLDLIFAPGFSTAVEVTDLSGRGVGMDVVRRTVEGLRGSIDLASEFGQGSCVTLRLPLTLAIVEGLLVETGGERYTLPLSAVQEIVALPSGHGDRLDRTRDHLDIRGRFVPFLRLRDLLDCPGNDPADPTVVVVASGGAGVGLVVDRIVGTHQTVIKQMTGLHAGVRAIAGATILGDGTVALILDALHLVTLGASLSDSLQTGDAA